MMRVLGGPVRSTILGVALLTGGLAADALAADDVCSRRSTPDIRPTQVDRQSLYCVRQHPDCGPLTWTSRIEGHRLMLQHTCALRAEPSKLALELEERSLNGAVVVTWQADCAGGRDGVEQSLREVFPNMFKARRELEEQVPRLAVWDLTGDGGKLELVRHNASHTVRKGRLPSDICRPPVERGARSSVRPDTSILVATCPGARPVPELVSDCTDFTYDREILKVDASRLASRDSTRRGSERLLDIEYPELRLEDVRHGESTKPCVSPFGPQPKEGELTIEWPSDQAWVGMRTRDFADTGCGLATLDNADELLFHWFTYLLETEPKYKTPAMYALVDPKRQLRAVWEDPDFAKSVHAKITEEDGVPTLSKETLRRLGQDAYDDRLEQAASSAPRDRHDDLEGQLDQHEQRFRDNEDLVDKALKTLKKLDRYHDKLRETLATAREHLRIGDEPLNRGHSEVVPHVKLLNIRIPPFEESSRQAKASQDEVDRQLATLEKVDAELRTCSDAFGRAETALGDLVDAGDEVTEDLLGRFRSARARVDAAIECASAVDAQLTLGEDGYEALAAKHERLVDESKDAHKELRQAVNDAPPSRFP